MGSLASERVYQGGLERRQCIRWQPDDAKFKFLSKESSKRAEIVRRREVRRLVKLAGFKMLYRSLALGNPLQIVAGTDALSEVQKRLHPGANPQRLSYILIP
jgi:hypothetical protein